ncbi:MAG: hypothetical protein V3V49_01425, partial [Candidatus Krumholzibacteria bacterium]
VSADMTRFLLKTTADLIRSQPSMATILTFYSPTAPPILSCTPRHLARILKAAAKEYPVVTVNGPRQSGKTVSADFFKDIDFWRQLAGQSDGPAGLVYGGDASSRRRGMSVVSWSDWM